MLRTCVFWFLLPACFGPQIIYAQKEYYIPKSLIIPSHYEKDQLYASIGRGGGYNLDLSYSFTDHFAIFTTGVLDRDTKKRTSLLGDRFNIEKNDYALKMGLGYFRRVHKRKFDKIIESYLGVGRYKVENYWYFIDYPDNGEITLAKYWNIFGQINICLSERRDELVFALRLSYNSYDSVYFYSTDWSSVYPESSYKNLAGLSADPVVSYSYKLHDFKFSLQFGLSIPVSWSKAERVNRFINQPPQMYKEDARPAALIGEVSVQYGLNLGDKKHQINK